MAQAFRNNRKDPAQGMRKVNYQGVAGKMDFTQSSCAGNWAEWGLFQFKAGELVYLGEALNN